MIQEAHRVYSGTQTIPVMLDICRDIERYCPDAIFLNYTNPMAMLCRAMQGETKVKVTGCATVSRACRNAGKLDRSSHE